MNIDPAVRTSFRPTANGFEARNVGPPYSCPPYVIASAVRRVVAGATLITPDGYDVTLNSIRLQTGDVDSVTRYTNHHATELAGIGRQLLSLNEQGSIQPPLTYYQEQSIQHLVHLVDQLPSE